MWAASTRGPAAPPGRYQVRVTAGGVTKTQDFEIRRNTAVPGVTDADLQAQFTLAKQISDRVSEANARSSASASIKTQITERTRQGARTPALKTAGAGARRQADGCRRRDLPAPAPQRSGSAELSDPVEQQAGRAAGNGRERRLSSDRAGLRGVQGALGQARQGAGAAGCAGEGRTWPTFNKALDGGRARAGEGRDLTPRREDRRQQPWRIAAAHAADRPARRPSRSARSDGLVPVRRGVLGRVSRRTVRTGCCRARRSRIWSTRRRASMARTRSRRSALALCARSAVDASRGSPASRVEIAEAALATARGRRQGAGRRCSSAAQPSGAPRLSPATASRCRSSPASSDLTLMRSAGFAPGVDRSTRTMARRDGLQRLLVGELSARWTYTSGDVTFGPSTARACATRSSRRSRGTRASRSSMRSMPLADVILSTYEEIADVTLSFHDVRTGRPICSRPAPRTRRPVRRRRRAGGRCRSDGRRGSPPN